MSNKRPPSKEIGPHYFAILSHPDHEEKIVLVPMKETPPFIAQQRFVAEKNILVLEVNCNEVIEPPAPLSQAEYQEWLDSVFKKYRHRKSGSKRARKSVYRLRYSNLAIDMNERATSGDGALEHSSVWSTLARYVTLTAVTVYAIYKIHEKWGDGDKRD